MIKPTDQERIEEYLERLRKRGANTLQMFESNIDFILAIKSDIGKEILRDLVDRHEHLFKRVASLEVTDAEKQTFLYIHEMLSLWSRKIADYQRRVKEFTTTAPDKPGKGEKNARR